MTQSSDNDDVMFDRLVDGELSASERESLLASLDERTEGWRRCALAFLEAQTWRRQMRQLVTAPLEETARHAPATLTPAAQGCDRRRAVPSLALAAGLLLAFTAGWLVRPSGSGVDATNQLADSTVEKNVSPEDIAKNIGPNDAVTLLVRDTEGKPQRVRVPLVDSAGLDDRLGTMLTSLPPGYREDLHQQGFDLHGRRRYAPLYFEQNDQLVPMVVPVDDAYVVPVSRHVY
jgi:anti-sigma factor RsiW